MNVSNVELVYFIYSCVFFSVYHCFLFDSIVFKVKLCFNLVQKTFVEAYGMEFWTRLDKSIRRVHY